MQPKISIFKLKDQNFRFWFAIIAKGLATISLAFVSLLALGLATSVAVFLVNGFQQMIWASFPFFQQCLQYFCPKIQFAVGLSVFPWKFQAM